MRLAQEGSPTRALPRKFAFTVNALSALAVPTGADRIWVYDAKTPKLAYLLTARGATSFYLYAKVQGRPIRYRLGGGDMPIEQARRLCVARTAEINDGVNIQDKRRRDREEILESITLGTLWERYRDGWLKTKARKSTLVSDISLYKTTLKPWEGRRADQVTGGQCRHRHAELGAAVGHRTANKAMQLLRRMLNWARLPNPITKGAINWFPEVERERFLTADELRRFFAAIDAEPNATLRDYLKLAVLTGARRNNLQSMEWAAIDFDANVWTIPADQSKSRKSVRVVLSAAAMKIIDERRRAIDAEKAGHEVYVFPSSRRAGQNMTEPRGAFDRCRKAAMLTDVRLHDLRRTFGSWQAIAGASELIIGRSLGHSSSEATHVYARLHDSPVRASVELATAAMLKAIGTRKRRKGAAKKK